MKKKFALPGIILIALAGSFMLWPDKNSVHANAPEAAPPPTEVNIATVTEQPVTFSKDLPGRTSPFRVAEIRPQVSGIIVKRLFEEGSDVIEGQQLYQIDPAPYQAAYDRARADLLKAEANVKSLKAKAARYQEIVKIGGVSRQDYDDTQASLSQGDADVAIAKAALATAKIDLNYTKVFSPIAGRIGSSLVTEGALVTANQAAPLSTVQQFDRIYVDVTQSSSDVMKLRDQYDEATEGEEAPPVKLVIDGKEHGEEGALQFSDIRVNQTTGTVQIRALFPNPGGRILPGLFVHARLTQYKDDAAILIPQKSIMRNSDGSVTVWVVDAENKVAAQPIKVAETIGDQWRVTEGLKAGDKVVTEGIMKIAPGVTVKPVEEALAAPEAELQNDQAKQAE